MHIYKKLLKYETTPKWKSPSVIFFLGDEKIPHNNRMVIHKA